MKKVLVGTIIAGLCIFLYTFYLYESANLPIPSYNELYLHKGKILSAKVHVSRGKSSRCSLLVTLDTEPSRDIDLPCYGDYKEITNLVGESAEIRTYIQGVWDLFYKKSTWDVVVSGKHYYKYEFRKSNRPKSKSFSYWVIGFFWAAYSLWLFFIYKLFKKHNKNEETNNLP